MAHAIFSQLLRHLSLGLEFGSARKSIYQFSSQCNAISLQRDAMVVILSLLVTFWKTSTLLMKNVLLMILVLSLMTVANCIKNVNPSQKLQILTTLAVTMEA